MVQKGSVLLEPLEGSDLGSRRRAAALFEDMLQDDFEDVVTERKPQRRSPYQDFELRTGSRMLDAVVSNDIPTILF